MTAATAPWRGRRLHFLGVAGAGMSAYARAAAALGARVSGSDRAPSPFSEALWADGVLEAVIEPDGGALPDDAGLELVCSSAIPSSHPQREAALARGLPVRSRAELLGELTALRRTIAIAGAHGKTTTASMTVAALRAAGLDPGYLVGGILRETGRNGDWGSGEWLVVEADESDRSMLALTVEIAVLTTVELDHHDVFGSLLEVERVYRAFLAAAPVRVVWDRPELRALAGAAAVTAYEPHAVELVAGGSRFRYEDLEVALAVPGLHNARNACAALAVARLAGADLPRAAAGLAGFGGAVRRFQLLGRSGRGAAVYDDYAHHPTEIAATIAAARTLSAGRLVAVFQPHLYSRTAALAREFGAALAAADAVVVLDVYPARERAADFAGVSGLTVAEAVADAARGRPVYWMPDRALAVETAAGLAGPGDVVLVMGAGDVDEIGRALVAAGGEPAGPAAEREAGGGGG